MRTCVNVEHDLADKNLNKTYQDLYNILSTLGRKKLKQTELAWIAFRKTECEFSVYPEEGGTLTPLILENCYLDMTQKRLLKLNKYLAFYKKYADHKSGATGLKSHYIYG